jgi:hypothetical protein
MWWGLGIYPSLEGVEFIFSTCYTLAWFCCTFFVRIDKSTAPLLLQTPNLQGAITKILFRLSEARGASASLLTLSDRNASLFKHFLFLIFLIMRSLTSTHPYKPFSYIRREQTE